MCVALLLLKKRSCVCVLGEKNRARRRTKNFVFFVFFVFFLFVFTRKERAVFFLSPSFFSALFHRAREFVSHHQRINLFVVLDFKRNSSFVVEIHTQRERES